jgi:hypothetical protein
MRITPAALLLAIAPLLTGCGDSAAAAHARQQSVEALAALRSYTVDQREAFVQELSARMTLLDRQLDELKARSARSAAGAKAEIEDALAGLQEKRDALADHLLHVRQVSQDGWTRSRDATVDSFENLTDGINAAAGRFGDA